MLNVFIVQGMMVEKIESNDFLDTLGEVALGSRLKRMSERLIADASQIYKLNGLEIQPKWFTLLSLLSHQEQVSIVEASARLGLTQPAISQFSKELISRELIQCQVSARDSRRKILMLSKKGHQLVDTMRPVWLAVEQASKQLCSHAGNDFLDRVKIFEQAFNEASLLQRTLSIMQENQRMTDKEGRYRLNPEVDIIEFQPGLSRYFKAINTQWINDMFTLEEADKRMLDDPEKIIIANGGKIYFAIHPEFGIVGTCALLRKEKATYELTKMGVLKAARGLKIGETLLQHVICECKRMKITNLFLLTNSQCEAAIHLYRKFGFNDDQETMERYASKYHRCDVAMRFFDN